MQSSKKSSGQQLCRFPYYTCMADHLPIYDHYENNVSLSGVDIVLIMIKHLNVKLKIRVYKILKSVLM